MLNIRLHIQYHVLHYNPVALPQASLLRMLPLVGVSTILSGIHMCMLHALYAFEYRWFNMGWELYKRLR